MGEGALAGNDPSDRAGGFEKLISSEPTPAFLALMSDRCRQLMAMLPDDTTRDVAQLRLDGYTTDEIAERLQVAPRTVNRKSRLIRALWETELMSRDE